MQKPGLILKTIIDINGHTTKRWVRPNTPTQKPEKVAPASPSPQRGVSANAVYERMAREIRRESKNFDVKVKLSRYIHENPKATEADVRELPEFENIDSGDFQAVKENEEYMYLTLEEAIGAGAENLFGGVAGKMIGYTAVYSIDEDETMVDILFEKAAISRVFKGNEVHMEEFAANKAETKKGFGTKFFKAQVDFFKQKGFEALKTHAARSITGTYNGYYTWARLGYSMDEIFTPRFRSNLKKAGREEENLEELMSTKEGRDFWQKEGYGFDGTFDLRDGSENMYFLEKYIKDNSKNIDLSEKYTKEESASSAQYFRMAKNIRIYAEEQQLTMNLREYLKRNPSKTFSEIQKMPQFKDAWLHQYRTAKDKEKICLTLEEALGTKGEDLFGGIAGKMIAYTAQKDPSSNETEVSILFEKAAIHRTFMTDGEVRMDEFAVNKLAAEKGFGTKFFKAQVDFFKERGFKFMSTFAAGFGKNRENTDYNGYYTWARLGYATSKGFKPELKSKIESAGLKAEGIEDLMTTKEGRDLWKQEGYGFQGRFDLEDNSRSMSTLERYIQER